MKTKMTTTLLAVFGAVALAASAQDNNPPGDGAPPADAPKHLQREGGPGGRSGIHILPPRAAEILKLTDDQKTQIAALEAETKAKLEKILTPDQMKQLKSLRPPMRQGGAGGPGQAMAPVRATAACRRDRPQVKVATITADPPARLRATNKTTSVRVNGKAADWRITPGVNSQSAAPFIICRRESAYLSQPPCPNYFASSRRTVSNPASIAMPPQMK